MHLFAKLLIALLSLSTHAYANFLATKPDCVFFEKASLQGHFFISKFPDQFPYSADLETSWQASQPQSLWVRADFVLEAFSEKNFGGDMVSLDAFSSHARPYAEGVTFDLSGLAMTGNVASYRCRPLGVELWLEKGHVLWFEGQVFNWSSGGNHPDHKSLTMVKSTDGHKIQVHSDRDYGITRRDYELHLENNRLHIEYTNYGLPNLSKDIDLQTPSLDAESLKILREFYQDVTVVAEGRPQDYWSPEPPKPELKSLINYLYQLVKDAEKS